MKLHQLSIADLKALLEFCDEQVKYWEKVDTAKDEATEKEHQCEFNMWVDRCDKIDDILFEKTAQIEWD